VGHDDGPVEPEVIEVVAGEGEVAAGAPAEASDPVRLRFPDGLLDERGPYGGGVLRLRQICPPRFEGGQREVVVGVDEAGQQCPAARSTTSASGRESRIERGPTAAMRSPSTSSTSA
jgi:hypothetical protein